MQKHEEDLAIHAQQVLNRNVRPLLNICAGDVEIVAVRERQVELALIGTCGRCMFKTNCVHNQIVPTLMSELGQPHESFKVHGVRIKPAALILDSEPTDSA